MPWRSRRQADRLEDGRLDDAIAMAWAGLEQAAELPTSPSRFTLIESLMLVVVDARVQVELSRRAVSDTVTVSRSRAGEPPRDPTTGLSTEAPPDRPSPLAEALAGLGEPPDLPERIINYPPDWRGAGQRNRSLQTPTFYESEPYEDGNGETVQTVVYDVRTLILPTPTGLFVPLRDLYDSTRIAADRHALRTGSAIFNGYAQDLDAGIPLMHGFGGSSSWPVGLGNDEREMAELARLIDEMTSR